MRRKFFTNLSLLLFLNLLIKPFWIFGIDRTVQNIVGAEEYGLYFSLFNFSLLLNMLLDLGITNYNNRNIAQNSHLLSKSLSSIISLRILLALAYALVTILAALFVGYQGRQFHLLFFLVFNQFVASFILYLRSNLSGLHYFKTDSLLSVLDRFIMIVICGLLLWGGVTETPFQIEWFVYAQTTAYLLTLALSLGFVYSKAEFIKLKFDRTYFIAILKKSYPFALLSLLMAFYYRIDSVMLERMLPAGKEQAGIYAQGFRILDAAAMFAFLYAGLLLPMFSRMIKQKKSVHQLTLFSFLLLIVPVVGITFASYFYRTELIDLLYHHHVETSARIFGVLILCFLGISTSYIFGTLLTANGNLKELNMMAFGGVIINIVLNLILIPEYFALGSAIASLITQSFVAILQVLLARKIFQFSINFKRIAAFVFFIGGVLLFAMFSVDLEFKWIYKFIAILVFTLILAFILRLIHLKVLVDLLKNGDEQ
ncbi:MAG: oligosaccharide flippase family protein [Bacteroidales bacterium]|nr:oligosaccharide flippase family protein [Bacteroidales bacterium]